MIGARVNAVINVIAGCPPVWLRVFKTRPGEPPVI
jgi:hypothetical protein